MREKQGFVYLHQQEAAAAPALQVLCISFLKIIALFPVPLRIIYLVLWLSWH